MKPEDEPPSLAALEDKIRKFQRKASPPAPVAPQGMPAALRMGVELASGVLVGAGIGIFLDRWLGTSPVLCILCFLLGAVGGFWNIYRTMTAMDKDIGQAAAPPVPDDDEDE